MLQVKPQIIKLIGCIFMLFITHSVNRTNFTLISPQTEGISTPPLSRGRASHLNAVTNLRCLNVCRLKFQRSDKQLTCKI